MTTVEQSLPITADFELAEVRAAVDRLVTAGAVAPVPLASQVGV